MNQVDLDMALVGSELATHDGVGVGAVAGRPEVGRRWLAIRLRDCSGPPRLIREWTVGEGAE